MSLRVRRFKSGDIAELMTWFADAEAVLQWAGASMPYPLHPRDLKAIIRAHRGSEPQQEAWSAVSPEETLSGHFQIWFNTRLRQATLGRIAIAPALRGQGLAGPLVEHALAQAFLRTWVNRVELRVYSHNTIAIAAYQRAGFVSEGTRRQSTPFGDTFWHTNVMSVLREEYEMFDKRTERE